MIIFNKSHFDNEAFQKTLELVKGSTDGLSEEQLWRLTMTCLALEIENADVLLVVGNENAFKSPEEAVNVTGGMIYKNIFNSAATIAKFNSVPENALFHVVYVHDDIQKLSIEQWGLMLRDLQLHLRPGGMLILNHDLNCNKGVPHTTTLKSLYEDCYLKRDDCEIGKMMGQETDNVLVSQATKTIPAISILRRMTREDICSLPENRQHVWWWQEPGKHTNAQVLSRKVMEAIFPHFLTNDEQKQITETADLVKYPMCNGYCSPEMSKQTHINKIANTVFYTLERFDPNEIDGCIQNIKDTEANLILVTISSDNLAHNFTVHDRKWWVNKLVDAGLTYIGDGACFEEMVPVWEEAIKEAKSDESKAVIKKFRNDTYILSTVSAKECISRIWSREDHIGVFRSDDPRKVNIPFVISELKKYPKGDIIVVGQGPELYLGAFSNSIKAVDIIGSDDSVWYKNSPGVEWIKFTDDTAIPMDNNSVDFAVSLTYIPRFPDIIQKRMISEIGRVLRPGGRAMVHMWPTASEMKAIGEHNTFFNFYTKDAEIVKSWFSASGMIVDSIRPTPNGGRVVMATFAPILALANFDSSAPMDAVPPSESARTTSQTILPLVGVTSVNDGIKNQYPFMGAIKSAMRICNKIFIRVGGNDGTLEKLLKEFQGNDNVIIWHDVKEYDNPFRETKQAIMDFARGFEFKNKEGKVLWTGKDVDFWYWFDIDEVAADEDAQDIRAYAVSNAPYDLIYFREVMLWKDYTKILYDDGRPAHAFVIRNVDPITFVGDGFRIDETDKRVGVDRSVKIYHYGICRDLDILVAKRNKQASCDGGTSLIPITATWDDIGRELFPDKRTEIVDGKEQKISDFCEHKLLPFLGTHPEYMELGDSRQRRVGIVRSAGIGDHIMSEPLIRAINKAYNSNGYDVAIDYYYDPAYGGHSGLPSQFILADHPNLSTHSCNLMDMRGRKPDLLLWCERATDARHTEAVIDALLKVGGVDWSQFLTPAEKSPKIPLPIQMKMICRQFRDRVGDKFVVGITLGTTDQKKGPLKKDIESFILEMSNNKDILVVVMGEDGDVNKPDERLFAGKDNIMYLVGKQTVQQSAAVTLGCDIIVSNDSASHHIAGALGVPCIGIFTAFNGYYLSAYYNNFMMYQVPCECSPCYKHRGQPCNNKLKCLDCIEWAKIMSYVNDMFGKWKSSKVV